MDSIVISKPDKCHLWSASLTRNLLLNAFDTVKTYQDDYHNTRKIEKCKICGQLYFAEFLEEIDFIEGEDQEYYVFIPMDNIETGDKLNKLSRLELAGFIGIFMNFPPYNSNPYWNNR